MLGTTRSEHLVGARRLHRRPAPSRFRLEEQGVAAERDPAIDGGGRGDDHLRQILVHEATLLGVPEGGVEPLGEEIDTRVNRLENRPFTR